MDFRTGELITVRQAENGVYIWEINNPLYFIVLDHLRRPFNQDHDIIKIQLRFNHNLRKAVGAHKIYLNVTIRTTMTPSSDGFLRRFKFHVMYDLNNLGILSLNNVIRAFNYVLQKWERVIVSSTFDYNVQFFND